jgi:acetyl-CoA carboxylase carboxyl transferase subunit alpha
MAVLVNPLEFERELVEFEIRLEALKDLVAGGDLTKKDEFTKLEAKVNKLRKDIYGKLTPYQRVQLSRHFDRPFTLDLIQLIFSDFVELHGDRACRDDPAIVGGLARIGEQRVMIIGHQRGRSTQERLKRNFGMPQPEGYRKALRLFHLAEKFEIPIITLIDTVGAYPGIEAEERGQSEAIARNLFEMSVLTVPVICVVIGEGGSGGALALGVGDRILMMENACYSVISPEACASILWPAGSSDDAPSDQAAAAAERLKITARDLSEFKVIDEIVAEPLGGAHNNHKEAAEFLKAALLRNIADLKVLSVGDLVEARYQKYRAIGPYAGDNV